MGTERAAHLGRCAPMVDDNVRNALEVQVVRLADEGAQVALAAVRCVQLVEVPRQVALQVERSRNSEP